MNDTQIDGSDTTASAPPAPTPPLPTMPPMFFNLAKMPALFAALAKAQGAYLPVVRNKLVVQKLKNRQTGEYSGGTIKFLYAELSSILDATRAALAENGLTFLQPAETIDGDWWVNSILAHADGGMMMTRTIVPEAKDMPQLGGFITYIRRYSAGPFLGVSAEDDADDREERDEGEGGNGFSGDRDDDSGGAQRASTRPARTVPARKTPAAKTTPAGVGTINEGQVKFLGGKLKALKLDDEQALAFYERVGVDGFSTALTLKQFADITHELDRMRDA